MTKENDARRSRPATTAPWILGLLSLVPLAAQTTTAVSVDATVVDDLGRPVAGAEFADRWEFVDGAWRGGMNCGAPDHREPLRTDGDGRLRGAWTMDPFGTPLLGFSSDRSLVAFATPRWDDKTHDCELRGRIALRPATLLTGAVRTVLGPADQLWLAVCFEHPDRPGLDGHMAFGAPGPRFSIPLPPGSYRFVVRSGHGESGARGAVLPPGRRAVDVGPISVSLRPFDLVGEVLPEWEEREAHESGRDREPVRLVAFRGAPLLIAFDEWGGYVAGGRQLREGLVRVAGHARRSDFGVVLFDTSEREPWPAASRESPEVETMFPVVHPASGRNADALYGSRWAIVVLDADGRLVHCGRDLDGAVAALDRLLEPARPK